MQTGDNSIVSNGSSVTITIPTTSTTNKTGVRISSTQTELYSAKVDVNGLKFDDSTIQTTAMTSNYLTSFIQNVVSQMTITPLIPVGTILTYGGKY